MKKKCPTCGQPPGSVPYYEEVCNETTQDHASIFKDTQFAAGVVIANEFQIPVVDEDIQVCVKDIVNIVVGSYLWHPAYGYLKIVYWDGCTQKIGLLNEGITGTAPAGTVVPECTGFVPSSRPCCEDEDNFQLFPFLAEDFEAPNVDGTRTIQVTSTFGLVQGTNIRIGTGVYFLESINSSLEIVIRNDGAGATPGSTVEARDSEGNLQYLITTIIVTACIATSVQVGRLIVCDGADEQILEGPFATMVPVLQNASTNEVEFEFIDTEVRVCTYLTAPLNILPSTPSYTIEVEDEAVFEIGQILQINFSDLRWEVTDNTTPGELDITCTIGNPGVTVTVPFGSPVCSIFTDEDLQDQIDEINSEIDTIDGQITAINNSISEIEGTLQTGWSPIIGGGFFQAADIFEMTGDVTPLLKIGQKFRLLLDGDLFYGNISAFAYEGITPGRTAITIVTNTDYVLTSDPITNVQFSNEDPVDFPAYFNYDLNPDGFSAISSQSGAYWILEAKVYGKGSVAGTSDSTSIKVNVPTPKQSSPLGNYIGNTYQVADNGVGSTDIGMVLLTSGVQASLYKEQALTGWTISGDKQAVFDFSYVMAQ